MVDADNLNRSQPIICMLSCRYGSGLPSREFTSTVIIERELNSDSHNHHLHLPPTYCGFVLFCSVVSFRVYYYYYLEVCGCLDPRLSCVVFG